MILYVNTGMLGTPTTRFRMVDPNRYLRAMYVTELDGIIDVYDGKAPTDVEPPYAVISSVGKTRFAARCVMWDCTVNLDLYFETDEFGGFQSLDELTDDILSAVTVRPLPAITGFGHVSAKLLSDDQNVIDNDTKKQYRKALRIQHIVQQ